jgi:hypothetical protein
VHLVFLLQIFRFLGEAGMECWGALMTGASRRCGFVVINNWSEWEDHNKVLWWADYSSRCCFFCFSDALAPKLLFCLGSDGKPVKWSAGWYIVRLESCNTVNIRRRIIWPCIDHVILCWAKIGLWGVVKYRQQKSEIVGKVTGNYLSGWSYSVSCDSQWDSRLFFCFRFICVPDDQLCWVIATADIFSKPHYSIISSKQVLLGLRPDWQCLIDYLQTVHSGMCTVVIECIYTFCWMLTNWSQKYMSLIVTVISHNESVSLDTNSGVYNRSNIQ